MKNKELQSRQKTPTLAFSQPQIEGKQPLWKEVQPGTKFNQMSLNECRKNSDQLEYDTHLLTPIRKKKQKSETISNFLKHLQVEVEQKDSRMETESEIVSMMDVKYTDSFYTHKRHLLGKSVIADSKFHIFLLISSIKEFQSSLKQTIAANLQTHKQETEFLYANTKKLLTRYESQLNQKNMEIKTLELQAREQRLNSVEQKYRIETQMRQLQDKNRQLEQKLLQIQRKYKEEQQLTKNEKNYNKELNELMLKFHKKVQQLEAKCEELKKQYDMTLASEMEKLTNKYQQLYNEQSHNYELKLENNRIKYENYIQTNIGNTSNLDLSKISDTASIQICNSVAGSRIEDSNWATESFNKTQVYKPNATNNKLNKKEKAEKERVLENTSSPKSNTSGRRFARTNKQTLEIPQKEKLETFKQGIPHLHTPNQKHFLSEDKPQRHSEHVEKNGPALNRQKFSKNNPQSSQPQLQIPRTSKMKLEQHNHSVSPACLFPQDKNAVITFEIHKLLDDSPIESAATIKSPTITVKSQRPTLTSKAAKNEDQPQSQTRLKIAPNTRIINQQIRDNNTIANFLASTVSTQKSNTGSNGNELNTKSSKNVVHIDKKLRETVI